MPPFDPVCLADVDDLSDDHSTLPVGGASGWRCKRKHSEMDSRLGAGSGWDSLVLCSAETDEEGRSDSARSGQDTPHLKGSSHHGTDFKHRLEVQTAVVSRCCCRVSPCTHSSDLMRALWNPQSSEPPSGLRAPSCTPFHATTKPSPDRGNAVLKEAMRCLLLES